MYFYWPTAEMRSCEIRIWPWNVQPPQNFNVCRVFDGRQPFSHADPVREIGLNAKKRRWYEIKAEVESPPIISSIPLAVKRWGENLENTRVQPC